MLADSMPYLVMAAVIYYVTEPSMISKEIDIQKLMEISVFVTKACLGLVLVFGGRGLLKVILRTTRTE